ncbi:splicing factor, Prp19-binding domain-containing protein [Crepidotus variabilis]|uniref:Splicing factor, Prp19-binding domain-containing protein n=1 Tax=Crepidotus variabilis TaxID=179855 RepID=A0A9P6EVA3_9AGAR|nr:splicing factor, Prp19-binding domain-containing protein [Crepidotus variabilis]
MSGTSRKQAPRLARPAARYWKGKAPKGVAEVQSDSEAEDEDQEVGDVEMEQEQDEDEEIEEFGMKSEAATSKLKGMNITLKDVNVSKEGKVIVAGREESGRTAVEEEESDEEEARPRKPVVAAEQDEESSEEESESEEEKIEFRPVFVPKRSRVTVAEREALAQDTEEALKKKEQEAEERRQQSHDLVAQTIRRELAEKEKEGEVIDVDDTDGLDPTAEFEAWRLRELGRIKKEKEAEVAREKEREEVERRRALPEEQRMKEDLEHAQKLREEKPKGQQKFLQKYWHKGAFHQVQILQRHDFTEATESTVDVSVLPALMQVKNFGKRSRTKYTHLVDQDTTIKAGGFGGHAPVKAGGSGTDGVGCFLCGGPHMKKGTEGPMPAKIVKVAVVGSGLAGLTAAHLLNNARESQDTQFEVHVFEKSSLIGMDSASISLPTSDPKETWRIDVPMRSFQGGYYTRLIELYKRIGVQLCQANFSYSFSTLRDVDNGRNRSITTTFIYNGASGRSGLGKPSSYNTVMEGKATLSSQFLSTAIFTISCLYTIFCFLLSLWHSIPIWRAKSIRDMDLRDWVLQVAPKGLLGRLFGLDVAWKDYVETVLIPTFSAVCTSPAEDVWGHPVEEFLDYIWLTFGTHHYIVQGGVCAVVNRLTNNLRAIHLSSPIQCIRPDPKNKACLSITCDIDGELEDHHGFHHIIFATQAPAAAGLLSTYLDALPTHLEHRSEKVELLVDCLQSFESRPSIVINHTDGSLLPDDLRDVRELNLISAATTGASYLIKSGPSHPLYSSPSHSMATHILRRHPAYPKDKPTVYQSTNPLLPPRKDAILSVGKLERAVVTMKSKRALSGLCEEESKQWWQCPYQAKTRLGPLQGARPTSEPDAPGIWFCGSYAYLGIPLLEGCVISAQNVVEQGIFKDEEIRWEEVPEP